MNGISRCKTCNKEFKWYRSKHQSIPEYCCRACFDIEPKSWVVERYKKFKNDEEFRKYNYKNRFEKRVIKKDGCWDWKGCQHHSGYLPFKTMDRKNDFAHRASWRIYIGEIPKGKLICHKCDNKRCTNPDHLYLGTHKENTQDMHEKKRGCYGEKNNKAVLTRIEVIEIRKLLKMGVKMTRIAEDYGVTDGNIWNIAHNITWKHIEDQ